MDSVIVRAQELRFRYPGAAAPALDGVSVTLARGELVAVAGPNGSGKTTLVRLLVGRLRALGGEVVVLGHPVERWNRRELARLVAVVAQREEPAFPLRVWDAVMLGRYPHLGPIGAPRAPDRAAVERALVRCDVERLAQRWVSTLSGGEWQRVRIARALAQEPQALLLDEPTANLDIRHEMELFELASELVHRDGLAGLMVTHHLNLAARYADRLVVLDGGAVAAAGPPDHVMRRELLEAVFRWPVEIVRLGLAPQFVPLKRSERPPPLSF